MRAKKTTAPPASSAAVPPGAESACEAWFRYAGKIRRLPDVPFEAQWAAYQEIYRGWDAAGGPPPAWRPGAEELKRSNIGRLMAELKLGSHEELHRWTADHRASFWKRAIDRLGIVFTRAPDVILDPERGARDPNWLPGAEMNIADSCFTADPDAPAVLTEREGEPGVRTTTVAELERLVNRFAGGLRERGFEEGDGIALYMPMNLECVAAYLGTVRAGLRVVSIADSFSPEEVRKRLAIGEARAVVTVDRYRRAGKSVEPYRNIEAAGAPAAVVVPSVATEPVALRRGDMLWNDFLSETDAFRSSVGHPYRLTNVLFSSGTTGTPKAIPWTHLTPVKCAMDGHFHQDIRPGDVVAWPTNIGWMMGPWLIYASLINGAAMALFEGAPLGPAFGRFVRECGVTMLGVVPSMVRSWRVGGDLEGIDWSRIRIFSSTGEPSNSEDYLWLMSRAGYRAPVIEYLGGTEIGGGHITGAVTRPASPATFSTPALGIDFVILDEDGRPVPEGGEGELFLVPPSIGLSQTLLNRDHAAEYDDGCPAGPRGEVLRRHGDRVARLGRGYFKARGRADDAMNLGGIKVSSLELEHVLETHPAVYECAAVAVQPSGEGAEQLVVYVVTGGAGAGALKADLQRLISSRLNPLFRIHDLVIADRLPRTASNKLMRRKLRDRYQKGQNGDNPLFQERGTGMGPDADRTGRTP